MNILARLRERFETALSEFFESPERYAAMVRPAQDLRFGDFQANCAMPLARQLGPTVAEDDDAAHHVRLRAANPAARARRASRIQETDCVARISTTKTMVSSSSMPALSLPPLGP